ncbi:MAG: ABC transporter [Desulfococcus sp. 4484_241]|nr:MAG: ABC transporter [Desulfococcus sp. 4484_241]
MRQVWSIFTREFRSYFVSPVAYIVIVVFLLVTGWLFFSPFFLQGQASMRAFFKLLPFVFSFVVPAVTMKLFAEELNTGSYELLLTLPVDLRQVLLGKLAAGAAFVLVMLLPTIVYAVSVSFVGDLDWGPVAGGYIGALLLGTAFSAIGLLASALTRSQIVAFIVASAICFGLTILDAMLFFLPGFMLDVAHYIAAETHFGNFSKGVIDTRDILYFASVAFLALYGAYLVLAEKR